MRYTVRAVGRMIEINGTPFTPAEASKRAFWLGNLARRKAERGQLVRPGLALMPVGDPLEPIDPADAFELASLIFDVACQVDRAVAMAGMLSGQSIRLTLAAEPECDAPMVLLAQ